MRRKNNPGCPCCGESPTCSVECDVCRSGKLPSILRITDANGTWVCGLETYFVSSVPYPQWVGYAYGNVARKNTSRFDLPSCVSFSAGTITYRYQIRCVEVDGEPFLEIKRQWKLQTSDGFFTPCNPAIYMDYLSSGFLIRSSTLRIGSPIDCSDFDVSGNLTLDTPSSPDPFGSSISIRPETEFPQPPYCCGLIQVTGCFGRSLTPFRGTANVRLYDEEGGTLLSTGRVDSRGMAYLVWPHRSSYWVEVDTPTERFRPIAQELVLEGSGASGYWQSRCGGGEFNTVPLASVSFQAAEGYVCFPRAPFGCAYPIKKELTFTTSKGSATVTYDETLDQWFGPLGFDAPVLTDLTYTGTPPLCTCTGCVIDTQEITTYLVVGDFFHVYPDYRVGTVSGVYPCVSTDKSLHLDGTYPNLTARCPAIPSGCDCGIICTASYVDTNTFFPSTTQFRVVCPKPDESIAFFVEGEFFSSGPIDGSYTITE